MSNDLAEIPSGTSEAQALAMLAGGNAQALSAADESAALRRPLADVVIDALQAAARSTHTARAYRQAIGTFLQFLDDRHGGALPPAWRPLATSTLAGRAGPGHAAAVWEFRGPAAVLRLVDAGTLDGFRASLEAGGATPNTATARVYGVRVFLSVALRDGILSETQGRRLGLKPYKARQKRDAKPTGRRLQPGEVKALRDAARSTAAGGPNKRARDLAILDAMLYAGLRRDEVARLSLGNITQDGGRYWLTLAGKGNKTRKVKIHDTLYKSLAAWAARAGLTLGAGDGALFRHVDKGDTIRAGRVNAATIGRLVGEYGARAGLAPAAGPNMLSAHDLRRTCARNAYDNGAPLLLVQMMLGHSDPKTTALYIGVDDEDGHTATDFINY